MGRPGGLSHIRMMLNYQGCGGLPYVTSVQHLVTQCFRTYGTKKHQDEPSVLLFEFQDAIKERHRIGDNGISAATSVTTSADDYA